MCNIMYVILCIDFLYIAKLKYMNITLLYKHSHLGLQHDQCLHCITGINSIFNII